MNGAEMGRMMSVHEWTARAYADERLDVRAGAGRLRTVVLAAIWVVVWEKPEAEAWNRIAELACCRPESWWLILNDDAPRYEPPEDGLGSRLCGEPGVRKPACGRRGTISFRVTNPADGTWRLRSFCDRHEAEHQAAWKAERELRAGGMVPEPHPNTGGLLPCYLDTDWPLMYRWARGSRWALPSAGVCADDWHPVPHTDERQPLKLIIGAGDDIPGRPAQAPALTLVPAR